MTEVLRGQTHSSVAAAEGLSLPPGSRCLLPALSDPGVCVWGGVQPESGGRQTTQEVDDKARNNGSASSCDFRLLIRGGGLPLPLPLYLHPPHTTPILSRKLHLHDSRAQRQCCSQAGNCKQKLDYKITCSMSALFTCLLCSFTRIL